MLTAACFAGNLFLGLDAGYRDHQDLCGPFRDVLRARLYRLGCIVPGDALLEVVRRKSAKHFGVPPI